MEGETLELIFAWRNEKMSEGAKKAHELDWGGTNEALAFYSAEISQRSPDKC